MEQDFFTGSRLIEKAREKREEFKQWQLYCSIYPNFTEETFIPWTDFYKKQNTKMSRKPVRLIKTDKAKLDKLFKKG